MKVRVIIFALLMLSGTKSYTFFAPSDVVKDKNKNQLVLTSAHTALFSADNLFKNRMSPNDINQWNNVLKGIKDFVQKNASEYMNYFNTLSKASDTLINSIKVIFNTKDNKDTAERQRLVLNNILILNTTRSQMIKIQKDLASEKTRITNKTIITASARQTKLLVIDLLSVLALTLELTCDKIINDSAKN